MTAPLPRHNDAAKAEGWMLQSFGDSMPTYMQLGKRDPFFRAVRETATVFTLGEVRETMEQYWAEDHPSGRGRHGYISSTSALQLMFVNMRVNGSVSIQGASDLLIDATPRELELLRIHPDALDPDSMYDRVWRAVHRAKDTLDRFPGDRHKRPSEEELADIFQEHRSDPARLRQLEVRMNTICNQILQGTWLMLPKELRERMSGTIALDATVIPVMGMQKNLGKFTDEDTASVNYDCGFYIREGDHDGTNAAPGKRIFGWEAELATMTRNKPGSDIDAPLFIVWFGGHKPGDISGEGKKMLDSLLKRGIPLKTLIADRAYLPNSMAPDLQIPASTRGASLVFDYPKNKLGKRAYYKSIDGHHDLVMCDGSWYPAFMPTTLQEAERLWADAKDEAAKMTNEKARKAFLASQHDLVEKRRAQRSKYRLTPKGRHRADGARQYTYPMGLDEVDWDQTTGEQFETKITRKTVLIPGILGKDNTEHLKYGQEFEYKSATWRGFYGLRNTIESVNSRVKDPAREGIHEPLHRRGRGPWFAEIAAALAAASQNLRRYIHFLQDRLALRKVTAKNRNQWMTYAKGVKNQRTLPVDGRQEESPEPPEYYLRPVWELFED